MEDEQQSTLKKKIQILFQLGKWMDVVKLCDSYGEKFGKDEEVELIRFKSGRHMGLPVPEAGRVAEAGQAAPRSGAAPMVPSPDAGIGNDVTAIPVPPAAAAAAPVAREEKVAYDSGPEADDLDVGELFADDELVISDPFADDKPEFNLAPDQPPVVINDPGTVSGSAVFDADELELDRAAAASPETADEDREPDFENIGSMTIDAEPDLGSPDAWVAASPEPRPEPVATMFVPPREKAPDDRPRVSGGYFDGGAEPWAASPAPAEKTEEAEKIKRPLVPAAELSEQKAPAARKVLGPKLLLLIVLPLVAATALWLALSGKLDFSGSEEPAAAPKPMVASPAVRKPRPAKPLTPPQLSPEVLEQEKAFAEKFRQAEALSQKGDLLNAWAVLLDAKSIKVTEPLRLLEEQLAQKMRAAEAQARKETEIVQNTQEMESQAFAKAESDGSIAAWNAFLESFPGGELALRAERRIAALEKKALENSQQLLLARIQQSQQVKLRTAYLNLSQSDIAALTQQAGRVPTRFETHEHGGQKVMLDFATGLMWTLWNKPMAYDKAKWWANRVTAGYGNWRLPTAEEAQSLLQIDRGLYAGLADFVVWTGDSVSDQPRTVWALRLPSGQFSAAATHQICYVWAVRKAGK